MVMAEPAYASAGPIRVDRRAADRRRGAAALLAAVTSGLAVTRDTIFARQRFEQVLRTLVHARSITLCEDPDAPAGEDVMVFNVPGRRAASSRASRSRVRGAAHARRLDLPAPRHGDAHRRAHPRDRAGAGAAVWPAATAWTARRRSSDRASRFAPCATASSASPRPISRCSSKANRAPARNSSRARSTS